MSVALQTFKNCLVEPFSIGSNKLLFQFFNGFYYCDYSVMSCKFLRWYVIEDVEPEVLNTFPQIEQVACCLDSLEQYFHT